MVRTFFGQDILWSGHYIFQRRLNSRDPTLLSNYYIANVHAAMVVKEKSCMKNQGFHQGYRIQVVHIHKKAFFQVPHQKLI